jgi:hypothetical protein
VIDSERSDLLAQLAACQERLASYIAVVDDVVERLGHNGSEPGDLLDALGEIEGMLAGRVTHESHDLAGLAEQVRQAIWQRERWWLQLADARNACDQRAAERDRAVLERDVAVRELVRVLVTPRLTPEMIAELRAAVPSASLIDSIGALLSTDGDMQRAVDQLRGAAT